MATSDTSNTSVIDFDGLVVRPVVVGLRDEWASEYSALLDDEWPDFLTRHATINMDILIVDNLNFDPDAKDDPDSCGLQRRVTDPRHVQGHTLDVWSSPEIPAASC